jgi:hypothetical protein
LEPLKPLEPLDQFKREANKINRAFIRALWETVSGVLNPTPWFIFSPYLIHRKNKRKVNELIYAIAEEPRFRDPKNLLIVTQVCDSVLFWRGWMMRIQWCIQIIAMFMLYLLVRRILHV